MTLKNIQTLAIEVLGRRLTQREVKKMSKWTKSYLDSFEADCGKVTKEDATIDYVQEIWYNNKAKMGRIDVKGAMKPPVQNGRELYKILKRKIRGKS